MDDKTGVLRMAVPAEEPGVGPTKIPIVVDVIADVAGDAPQPEVKDRKFTTVQSEEDVNKMMARTKPALTVPDLDGRPLALTFRSLFDFTPPALAQADPRAAALLKLRAKLSAVLDDLPGDKALQKRVAEALQSRAAMKAFLITL